MEITSKSYLSLYFDKSNIIVQEKSMSSLVREIECNDEVDVLSNAKSEIKDKPKDLYVPNKRMFDKEVLVLIRADFKDYDFKEPKIKKIFRDLIGVTLDKDDEEIVKPKAYNYFKKSLKDQLKKASSGNSNAVKSKSNKFDNFDQTIEDMSQDEFDSKVESSQKAKFSNEISATVEIEENDVNKKLYEQAIEKDWNVGPHTKNMAIKYAKENGLPYPEE